MASKPTRTIPDHFKTLPAASQWALGYGYHLTAYTDGAFRKEGNLGGWGYVVVNNKNPQQIKTVHGGVADTTTQRMEMLAITRLLESIVDTPYHVFVISDSQYCTKGINEWMPNWKANNWQTKGWGKKKPSGDVKNRDMWEYIDSLLARRQGTTYFQWVKGHLDCDGNNMADQAANDGVENLRRNGVH